MNEWKLNGPLQLTIGRLGFFPRGLLVLAVAVVAVVVAEEDDGGDIIDCLLLVLVGNVVCGVAIAISLGWDSYCEGLIDWEGCLIDDLLSAPRARLDFFSGWKKKTNVQ